MKLLFMAGARPNFMKVAPLLWECRKHASVQTILVHSGQHYDRVMSDLFFEQLSIPAPHHNLGVGGGSHATQTAEVMLRLEPILVREEPDAVVVVGDVNSTMAAAITAAKLGHRVAHVEAGLRSFDRTMPEEINRVLTDSVSDWLFASEPSAVVNLRREGFAEHQIHLVGNVMIDTLLACRDRALQMHTLDHLGLTPRGYAVLTLHRPSNVDHPETLGRLMATVGQIARWLPVVFPLHPRTRQQLQHLPHVLAPGIRTLDPLGYLEFLALMSNARLVLTDSGGIQEETTVLGVPCLTLRENTERPITLEQGTNQLVGLDPARILDTAERVLAHANGPPRRPALWDGHAAERILNVLAQTL
ncbi:MAG: hypothetical protein KatS3mg108_2024 [Isosphaeraceae bacterium]|jgi:UDP-N-acetylglucosamine 2-epimerase (non-hydrolysing)|nr:MAG: hypothetical protein KatS3mg108_2024 [Isosphaeraceae bacterium]